MAKRKRSKNRSGSSRQQKSKRRGFFLLVGAVVAAAIVFIAISGRVPFIGKEAKKGKSFYVQGGEKRPVLDPFLFTGLVRKAYAAAEKYPEVMDQVFCYCKCDEPPFYHKSLLSCFVDKHGAG
ncbi:MAG: hypothetical protein GTN74_06820 [Proteobacteria bacterium]|nr:hypothetical protein [Pseudomonadota bacterium]NIS69310.1 hypothetical protein [Pseudomonadota bacterium]